jgi:RNA polymerase sigma factor (sigma-70 family)
MNHGPRSTTRQPDALLMARAAAGDAAAFDALFRQHRAGLLGFLCRRLHSREAAEEALGIAFARAWRARSSFQGAATPGEEGAALREGAACVKAWLYRIALRVALDAQRSRRRHATAELDAHPEQAALLPDEAPLPLETVLERERRATARRAVAAALDRLRAEEARLVRLFYFEGHDYAEIGRLLGVSRSQVRGRLHRLRARLRRDLLQGAFPVA